MALTPMTDLPEGQVGVILSIRRDIWNEVICTRPINRLIVGNYFTGTRALNRNIHEALEVFRPINRQIFAVFEHTLTISRDIWEGLEVLRPITRRIIGRVTGAIKMNIFRARR